jgi:phage anti-repressor protein/phage antirepressor YoqD-like protein
MKVSQSDIGGQRVNSVNARDLHGFLEVGKDFSTWIKNRIDQYGFEQEKDYVLIDSPELGNQSGRGGDRRSKDYYLSLDMAKELSMVERNDRGKQARQYFIECERRANSKPPAGLPDFTNPAIAARAWAEQHERADQAVVALLETKQKLADAEPKVNALDRIATCQNGSLCITNAAKALQVNPKSLFGWLSSNQWIYRRPGGSGWIGYQHCIQSGYLEHKVTTVERGDGSRKVVEQVLITPRGIARLAQVQLPKPN